MPVLPTADYQSPFYLPNGHWQTIVPSLFRKIKNFEYQRERLELPDGDFLDLDWSKNGTKRLVILTHGLEGSSDRHYTKGTAKAFSENAWDVLAWNCRSCSGEMNRTTKLYYHGETNDISKVVHHALQQSDYQTIVLIGFSMGGAMSLNYLGRRNDIPKEVKSAIGFSMPTELGTSVELIHEHSNKLYHDRFLKKLKEKIAYKAAQFPNEIDATPLEKIKTLKAFDFYYSAPMNGFASPKDFYFYSSAYYVLDQIKVPFLICNAQNDPLLTPECSPEHLAKKLPNCHLEMTKTGGHVGFYPYQKKYSYMEVRALRWVESLGL
jgi:uncharacterized protein